MHNQWSGFYSAGNFSFAEGQFAFAWNSAAGTGLLGFAPVPEPGTFLLGVAAAGYGLWRQRRQR